MIICVMARVRELEAGSSGGGSGLRWRLGEGLVTTAYRLRLLEVASIVFIFLLVLMGHLI